MFSLVIASKPHTSIFPHMVQQAFLLKSPVTLNSCAVDTMRTKLLDRFGPDIRFQMFPRRFEFYLPSSKCCVVKFYNVDTTRRGTLWQLAKEHHHQGLTVNRPTIVIKSDPSNPLTDDEHAFFINMLDSVGFNVIHHDDEWCTNCLSRPSSAIYETHEGHKTPAVWHKLCDVCLLHSLYINIRFDSARINRCPQCGADDQDSIEALNRAYTERPAYAAFALYQGAKERLDPVEASILHDATRSDVIVP